MKKSRYTESQVTYALRQADAVTPVSDVCRSLCISEATFYNWRKKYGSMGASEVRRLRQLEGEVALSRPRYGYERIHTLLRREGWAVNHKRVHRLYCLEGLRVRRKKRLSLHRGPAPDGARSVGAWILSMTNWSTIGHFGCLQ